MFSVRHGNGNQSFLKSERLLRGLGAPITRRDHAAFALPLIGGNRLLLCQLPGIAIAIAPIAQAGGDIEKSLS